MTACHRDFVNDCVPPKSSQLMNFQKTLHLLEFSWNFAKIRHFNFLQFSWLGSQKSDPSIFSNFHDPGKRKKNQKPMKPFTFWKWKHLSKKNHILKMKGHSETHFWQHFDNENMFFRSKKVFNPFKKLQLAKSIKTGSRMLVVLNINWLIIPNPEFFQS